jgi:hypothetical protein
MRRPARPEQANGWSRYRHLVSPNGTIVLGAVDVDYCNRLHSEQLATALNSMRRRGNA